MKPDYIEEIIDAWYQEYPTKYGSIKDHSLYRLAYILVTLMLPVDHEYRHWQKDHRYMVTELRHDAK